MAKKLTADYGIWGLATRFAMLTALCLLSQNACWSAPLAKPQTQKKEAMIHCQVYEQQNFSAGKFTVYISEKYVRCNAMNGHGVVVAHAPDWHVTLYNKDGEYYDMPLKTWLRDGLGSSTGDLRVYFGGLKPADFKKSTYEGLPAIKVERELTLDHDLMLVDDKKSDPRRKPTKSKVIIVAGTNNFGSGPMNVYCGMLKVPPFGVPLYSMDRVLPGGYKKWSIRTLSITQKDLPVSSFTPPPGLKKAATISKVLYGTETEDMLLQMSGADH